MRRLTFVLFVLAGLGFVAVSCKKSSPYHYAIPQKTNDGWETASLDGEAMDGVLMGQLFKRIQAGSYKNIHSVLVVKNDKLVIEEYFPGRDSNGQERAYDREMRHELHSVSRA